MLRPQLNTLSKNTKIAVDFRKKILYNKSR